MPRSIAYILLLLTMLFWAINFYVVKIAMNYYTPEGVATWRYFFGVLSLLGIGLYQYGPRLFKQRFSRKDYWYMFLTSLFGVFLTIYFFNKGLKTTSAINGSLIIATSPAITALYSYFLLKKKVKLIQWFAIILSFFGVSIILVKGDLSKLADLQFEIGDLYIMMMALVFSLSQIIVSKYLSQIDAVLMTAISTLIGFLLFIMISIPEISHTPVPQALDFWTSILFMGLLGTGVAYTAFYYCVVHLGATISTLFMNLIPFFVLLLAYPFGESIAVSQLIGGSIVIIGLVIFSFSKESKP